MDDLIFVLQAASTGKKYINRKPDDKPNGRFKVVGVENETLLLISFLL